jgi:UDP-N-acetylglucosamine--dolichyl-phosphate N-acetylglucosaminephosphotransferase
VAAAVYILLLTLFAPLPYFSYFFYSGNGGSHHGIVPPLSGGAMDAGVEFPHHSLSTYLASLLSLLTAIFLGFLDDVFDIRWRYKLPIPSLFLFRSQHQRPS